MIFQIDSDLVKEYRKEDPNYVIEIDEASLNKDLCVIYFTSHNLYFPNNSKSFNKSIVEKNYYEWRQNPPISAFKQIFVRDIYKQWYIEGINDLTNTPTHLLNLLKKEVGSKKLITMGSSAGGYAAILYGILLKAEKIFAFNAQFELYSLLTSSKPEINPLIFKEYNFPEKKKYFDLLPFINNSKSKIYYFTSFYSNWDRQQYDHIKDIDSINIVRFKTSHHGIPFPKIILPKLLKYSEDKLNHLKNKTFNPITFSFKEVGFLKTIFFLISQGFKFIKSKIKK